MLSRLRDLALYQVPFHLLVFIRNLSILPRFRLRVRLRLQLRLHLDQAVEVEEELQVVLKCPLDQERLQEEERQ